jgi:alpha-D-ribose 1-methylphosphonate 5-triphosphate synthase subunit PhnG
MGDSRLSPAMPPDGVAARRRWMSLLALAPGEALQARWAALGEPPRYRRLRGPEVGLVMLRARAGGTGARFNLGEMTVTRCTVQLEDGTLGHAWVGGRDRRHAELAAVFDALLQDPERAAALGGPMLDELERYRQDRRREAAARAATSRVEFFTMVRGED